MSLLKKIKSLFVKKEEIIVKPKKSQQKRRKQLTKEEQKAKEERANRLLKEQLAKEKKKSKKTIRKTTRESNVTKVSIKPKKKQKRKQRITVSKIEQEAEEFATSNNTILFIGATTKRLRVIEWRKTKKRVILNKEREVRRTHKGGWSQEKFQHFVDSQKAKTADWIESNLTKSGVLRGPYDRVLIEVSEEKVRKRIEKVIKTI